MRLDIDDQVLTQLNKHSLFTIKSSRSVEFAASQIIYSTQLRPDRLQDPSIQDNALSKQCNTSTCYATAPLMQTPAPAAMLHLQCNTCYAKHLLLIQTPAPKFPPKAAPTRNAHQNVRTQTRNLSKFR